MPFSSAVCPGMNVQCTARDYSIISYLSRRMTRTPTANRGQARPRPVWVKAGVDHGSSRDGTTFVPCASSFCVSVYPQWEVAGVRHPEYYTVLGSQIGVKSPAEYSTETRILVLVHHILRSGQEARRVWNRPPRSAYTVNSFRDGGPGF